MSMMKVANVNDLKTGEGKVVEADGKELALFNVDGKFYAIDNTCTHRGGPLGEGFLEGDIVTCPWHGAKYDVRTGKVMGLPATQSVKSYRIIIKNNEIFVEL